MTHPGLPVKASSCCAAALRNKGSGRYCCRSCGRYVPRRRPPARCGTIRRDARGRARIWLGRSSVPQDGWRRVEVRTGRGRRTFYVHPLATSGGWQWLSRYLVMADLGHLLRRDEHVHHLDLDWRNDLPSNLEVLLAEYHGRLHASATVLWRRRGPDGRFLPEEAPVTRSWPRRGAILGRAAV